jgi:hypothetical protein
MGSYQQQQHTVVVATENSSSQAELLQMTLAAHGISATISPRAAGYPSLDFVAGIGVLVSPEDEQLARDILSGVGIKSDPPDTDAGS